jgi:hypothetical protein
MLSIWKTLQPSLARSIFIQIHDTPNPSSLKLILKDQKVYNTKKTYDFPTITAAGSSPLAKKLFCVFLYIRSKELNQYA